MKTCSSLTFAILVALAAVSCHSARESTVSTVSARHTARLETERADSLLRLFTLIADSPAVTIVELDSPRRITRFEARRIVLSDSCAAVSSARATAQVVDSIHSRVAASRQPASGGSTHLLLVSILLLALVLTLALRRFF